MLINLSLFNAEEGRSMSRVSIQAVNLDHPRKNGAHLRQLMAPVMPKSVAATAAPSPPAPAPTPAPAPVKKVAAAPTTPPPAAEAPDVHRHRITFGPW